MDDQMAQLQQQMQQLQRQVSDLRNETITAEGERGELRKLIGMNRAMIDVVTQHDDAIQEELVARIRAVQSESDMTAGFLGKAIAIFVAWHVSQVDF